MSIIAFPKVRADDYEPPQPTTESAMLGSDGEGTGYDRITVRVITVALVLSLFIHVLLLVLPLMRNTQPLKMPADEIGPLAVRIEPSAPAPAQPKAQPRPEPTPPPPTAPIVQPRPAPAPPRPRLTVPRPTPRVTTPPQIAVPVPAPPPEPQPQARPQPQQPPAQDMSEYIAQRRAARGAPTEGREETDDERANRIARANIQAQQRAASPEMVDGGGGLFQLDRTGLTDADFVFRGWSTDFKRNTGLTVHVTKGDNADIKLAVVRKMIEIIRERKNGDFEWYSYKRGKAITMSARPGDTARLEAFLLHEFYPEDPRGRDVR